MPAKRLKKVSNAVAIIVIVVSTGLFSLNIDVYIFKKFSDFIKYLGTWVYLIPLVSNLLKVLFFHVSFMSE